MGVKGATSWEHIVITVYQVSTVKIAKTSARKSAWKTNVFGKMELVSGVAYLNF